MLAIEDLSVYYGSAIALDGVGLRVEEGQIVSLIGRNGAGKTTLMKTVAGLMRPRRGKVLFQGKNICGQTPPRIVASGLRLVPEGRQIFPTLTVEENLMLGGFVQHNMVRVSGRFQQDLEKVITLFPWMKDRLAQKGSTLSGGEQQQLAIARALMTSPKLLLLDEPSLGVAPLVIKTIFDTLKELNGQGMTILLVEQNANLALRMSHVTYVLDEGRVVLHGPSEQLRADPKVQEIYLGGGSRRATG